MAFGADSLSVSDECARTWCNGSPSLSRQMGNKTQKIAPKCPSPAVTASSAMTLILTSTSLDRMSVSAPTLLSPWRRKRSSSVKP
jgi:hypothetical protein